MKNLKVMCWICCCFFSENSASFPAMKFVVDSFRIPGDGDELIWHQKEIQSLSCLFISRSISNFIISGFRVNIKPAQSAAGMQKAGKSWLIVSFQTECV